MMNLLDIMKTFYVKQVYFKGESNSIVELISVTKETVGKMNGVQVKTPETLSSFIREITSKEAADKGICLEKSSENKVIITEEQANNLSVLVDDPDSYINAIYALI